MVKNTKNEDDKQEPNESNVTQTRYSRFTHEFSPVPFSASSRHSFQSKIHQRYIFWACDLYSFRIIHQQDKPKNSN